MFQVYFIFNIHPECSLTPNSTEKGIERTIELDAEPESAQKLWKRWLKSLDPAEEIQRLRSMVGVQGEKSVSIPGQEKATWNVSNLEEK